nr:gamma aminobutyric acid receptor subunit [Hymenolepis microstoma]
MARHCSTESEVSFSTSVPVLCQPFNQHPALPMSHFPQRPDRNTSSSTSLPRRKEAGPSLAVDILRGRGFAKQDYTVGCLTSTASPQLNKSHNKPNILPIYTEGAPFERSIESKTVAGCVVPNHNTSIRPRLSSPPSPPSRQECFPLTDIFEDIHASHSIQRRPANMGWTGSRSLDGRRFENNIFYENPLSFISRNSPVAEEREIDTQPIRINSSKNECSNNLEKTLFARIIQPQRSIMSADDETPLPQSSATPPRYSISSNSNSKPLRQRSPWKSFLKESVVPDVPVDNLESPRKKNGQRRPSRLKFFSPSHRRPSLEKSVTWRDDRKKAQKVDKQVLPTQYSMEAQTTQMDELVSVLAELCDTLENSSIFVSASLKREASLDICPPISTQLLSKMTDHRRRSLDLGRDIKQLSIRHEKVVVEVRVVFLKIGEIDTLKEFYQADAFLQTKWREPRLDGKLPDELGTADLERYWNPLCYIDNILSETKEVQWLSTSVSPRGEVYIIERRRIKGVFLETLELNDFPLDVQDLTITVTTERPDTEVDLIPDHNEMSAINKQTFVDQQEWKLHEHVEITKRVIRQEYSRSMKSHPCLSVTCRAARRPGYFYWNVFLIMFMISGLSFATFAVSPDKAELRLRLSFTLILTSVTFKYVITQSLPRISYLTYMDKYVLMSLAILCVISIWHAVIAILPIHVDYPFDNMTTLNSSAAFSMNVSAINPNLLHETLRDAAPSIPITTAAHHSTVPKTPTQPRDWTTYGSVESEPSLSKDSYFDMPAPPYIRSETPRKSGASLGSYILTNEMVSLYFLALLRAYMEVQDCAELSRFPDAKQAEEAMRLEVMKRLEQNVFISFGVLYVVIHLIFVFILWFDHSGGGGKVVGDAELEAILSEDSCQTREELSESLGVSEQAISKQLKQLGMIEKGGYWVPHELKPRRGVERRLFACEQLVDRQTRKGFLHRIVTGDDSCQK